MTSTVPTTPLALALPAIRMRYAAQQHLIKRELDTFASLLTAGPAELPVNVQALLNHIHAHLFEEQLNVGHALRACDLKDNNASSRFKLQMGRGLRAYIEDLRLMAAVRLLWHRDLDVYLIASAVGYKYHESFTRAFKRSLDHTPSDFRQQFVVESQVPTPLLDLAERNQSVESLAPS